MPTTKTAFYWFSVFAVCSIAYQQIQDNIRPGYSGDNPTIRYFLGVAPNFFPAIGLPALFIILLPQIAGKRKTAKWFNEKKHITSNLVALTGLIFWEFLQMTGNLKFDWNDILWTLLGGFLFHLIWLVSPAKYKSSLLD